MKRKTPEVFRIDLKIIAVSMVSPACFMEGWKICFSSVKTNLFFFFKWWYGYIFHLTPISDMVKGRLLFHYPIWNIVSVGYSHPDFVALSILKDKKEKILKLETLAFFHRNTDWQTKFRLPLIYLHFLFISHYNSSLKVLRGKSLFQILKTLIFTLVNLHQSFFNIQVLIISILQNKSRST